MDYCTFPGALQINHVNYTNRNERSPGEKMRFPETCEGEIHGKNQRKT